MTISGNRRDQSQERRSDLFFGGILERKVMIFSKNYEVRFMMGLLLLPIMQGIPPSVLFFLFKEGNLVESFEVFKIVSVSAALAMAPFNMLYTLALEYFLSRIKSDIIFIIVGTLTSFVISLIFIFVLYLDKSGVYVLSYLFLKEILGNIYMNEKTLLTFAIFVGFSFSAIFRWHYRMSYRI